MNLRERELLVERLEAEIRRHKLVLARGTARTLCRLGYEKVSHVPSERFGFVATWVRKRKRGV